MLLIAHPNYELDRLDSVMDSIKKEMARLNMNVMDIEVWGKRKLAYLINKQRYGSYVLVYFQADPKNVGEFHEWMEIQSVILHQLIVKLEENPMIDESEASSENETKKKPVEKPVEKTEESAEVSESEKTEENTDSDDSNVKNADEPAAEENKKEPAESEGE